MDGQAMDTIHEENYLKIGEGDDGLVVLDRSTNQALKIYSVMEGYTQEKKALVEDQAYREFKALKIIGPHVNVIRLLSDEMEYFEGEIFRKNFTHSPYIRLEYVENLLNIGDTARFWGVEVKKSSYVKKTVMNFEHRNQIVKHVMRQMLDTLSLLKLHKIRHRDMDSVNVKLKFPDMILKVMDFARADVPDVPGLKKTENPDLIVQTASEQIRGGDQNVIWKDCERAYKNPVNSNASQDSLPPGVEYTDKIALRSTLKQEMRPHIKTHFEWAGYHNKQAVIDENLTLLALMNSVWTMPGKKVGKFFEGLDVEEALIFMRENTDLCLKARLSYRKLLSPTSKDEAIAFLNGSTGESPDFLSDRLIVHSSDYLSRAFQEDPLYL